MKKTFKNKKEFLDFIKKQINIDLKNEDIVLNKNRNRLYTEIPRRIYNPVMMFLNHYGIRYEEHVNNCYWIYIK